MPGALCHIVPRDLVLRLSLLLLFVAFVCILSGVCLLGAGKEDGIFRFFTLVPHEAFVEKGKIMVRLNGVTNDLCSDTGRVSLFAQTRLASTWGTPALALAAERTARDECDGFARESGRSYGLAIAATVTAFVALVVSLFLVVPCAKTTTHIAGFIALLLVAPTVLILSATGTDYWNAVPHGIGFVAAYAGLPTASVTYDQKAGYWLFVASSFFTLVALAIALLRLLTLCVLRPGWKREHHRARDIDAVMANRATNDDTSRQKAMWKQHVDKVCTTLQIEIEPEHAKTAAPYS